MVPEPWVAEQEGRGRAQVRRLESSRAERERSSTTDGPSGESSRALADIKASIAGALASLRPRRRSETDVETWFAASQSSSTTASTCSSLLVSRGRRLRGLVECNAARLFDSARALACTERCSPRCSRARGEERGAAESGRREESEKCAGKANSSSQGSGARAARQSGSRAVRVVRSEISSASASS